jgi:hypothetical protein
MHKPLYLVVVAVTAMLVLGFWANSAPSPIRHAAATSAGISIGDLHRLIDMNALPIQQVDDPM